MNKERVKLFLGVQGAFFKDVLVAYFAPVKLAWAFLDMMMELPRQMLVSLAMKSDEYETLQEYKMEEETLELVMSITQEQAEAFEKELE